MFDKSKSIFFRESLYHKEEPQIIDNRAPINKQSLYLTLPTFFNRTYGIRISFKNDEMLENERSVTYEINLKTSKNQDDPFFTTSINKTNIRINDTLPDLMMEELSLKIMNTIYPIQSKVDQEFTRYTDIVNHADILKKWDSLQDELMNKYEGALMDDILFQTDKKITNIDELTNALQKDMSWSALFHPILGNYEMEQSRPQDMLFPIGGNEIILFEGTQYIYPYETDYKTIKIYYDGASENKKTLKACYDIDSNTHTIKYIRIEYQNIETAENILFSAYDLETSALDNFFDTEIEVLPTEVKKKKSFWSFLD